MQARTSVAVRASTAAVTKFVVENVIMTITWQAAAGLFDADGQFHTLTKTQDHMSLITRFGLAGLALMSSMMLTGLSVRIERTGPELVQYGNLCGPGNDAPCYQPVLKGGFPFACLVDMPGVSVERKLGFEDTLSAGALLLDIASYAALVLLAMRLVRRRSRRCR